MKKSVSRKERLCIISSILTQNPGTVYSLSHFAAMFGAAKSTMSEDLAIVRDTFEKAGMGSISVILGANGGVKYIPLMSREEIREFSSSLADKLCDPSRVLPGDFIYTADIFSDPYYIDKMAKIIYTSYADAAPDFIITIETKGIPLAMQVARLFGKKLVIVRKESKLTEGSVVTLNYISASSKRMQAMSVSKRAVREGQRALIVDDFLAGGGTVSAISDMMREFNIKVVGCGVAIATKEPQKKRIYDYKSIITLNKIDGQEGVINAVSSLTL